MNTNYINHKANERTNRDLMTINKEIKYECYENGKRNGIINVQEEKNGFNGFFKCYPTNANFVCLINLKNLRTLNLSNCGLSSIPDLSLLQNLVSLNLSHNLLRTLSSKCRYLNKLRNLNLSNNCLTEVPSCISDGLGVLKTLDLSYNKLLDFNVKNQVSLQLLETLNLSGNQLLNFPQWLISNRNCCVKELDISYNCEVLKNNISNEIISDLILMKNSLSKSLRVLKLSCCLFCKGKETFLSAFKNLEVLYLSNDILPLSKGKINVHNRLFHIPVNNLLNVKNMQELHLSGVYLVDIKSDIKKFVQLKVLVLSYNDINELPSEICELKQLEHLDVSNNFLSCLPNGFGKLASLKKLFLSVNKLLELPQSFGNLENLEVLDLYDNYIEELPEFLFEMNLKELDLALNYFNPFSASSDLYCDKYRNLRKEFIKNTLKSAFNRSDCQREVSDYDENDFNDCGDEETDKSSVVFYRKEDILEDEYEDELHIQKSINEDMMNKENSEEKVDVDKQEDEENWDQDYDSDEMFNPNDALPLPYCHVGQQGIQIVYNENGYVPGNYHPAAIYYKKKYRENNFVEGQFDDA